MTSIGQTISTSEDGYGLSLRDVISILRRRILVILSVAFVLTCAVVTYNLIQDPVYEASTTVVIGEEQASSSIEQPLQGQVMGLQELAPIIATAADSRRVAEATIQQLNMRVTPSDFNKNMSAEQITDSPFIELKYRDTSPAKAKEVVSTVAEVFPDHVSELNMGTTGTVTVEVWDPPAVSEDPVSPNPLRDGFLALVLGLVAGVGLALLREHLDDGWRTLEEVEKISRVPTYALIPTYKPSADKRSAVRALPSSVRSVRSLLTSEKPNGRGV